jgi:hypothetical protein
MNHVGIFVYGSIVSVIVLTAYALMVWASIEDGREQRAHERPTPDAGAATGPSPQSEPLPTPSMVGVE